MTSKSYTTNSGILVTEYQEEREGEYFEYITKRMHEKPKTPQRVVFGYEDYPDETLLEFKHRYEKDPDLYSKKLWRLYNELTRRRL